MSRANRNPAIACSIGKLLAWATLLLASVVILAHAGLILAGHWDGDEFFNFVHYRESGLSFLWFRMLTWSPRPLSELLLYLYALAVNQAHDALITPFLALLWAILVASAIAATWRRDGLPSYRLALALSIVAMFLLSYRISDMFLWPMAAAAYLPALAGLMLAAFQIMDGRIGERGGRVIVAAALSLAVLSSETGVFFIAGFAPALFVLEAPRLWSGGVRRLAQSWWYLVPLVLSLAVLACALRFRVGDATSGVAPTNRYFHHLILSLHATAATLPQEVKLGEAPMTARNLVASIAADGLLLAGVFGIYRTRLQPAPAWRYLLALAIGLLSGMVLLILASYYQYGGWGFGRHRTFFHCFLILLLVVLGRGVAAAVPLPRPATAILGPACLAAAMALGFAPRVPLLAADYARIPQVRAARAETWDSGSAAGGAMRFVLPPPGPVIGRLPWQTGSFTASGPGPVPWYVPGVLSFFGKNRVSIVASGGSGVAP